MHMNLRQKVFKLEQSLKQSPATPPKSPLQNQHVSHVQAAQHIYKIPAREVSTKSNSFFVWLRDDWIMKLGAFLLLIGFGWLTTYAFLNNWIGPVGRILIGIFAGLAILVLGWWRIRTYINQGSVFLILGSTTVLLTIFAAREVYGFFTPASALFIMFLSASFVAFVSLSYNTKQLAFASLIFASIAPLLVHSPTTDYPSLFAYLFVIIVGTIWLAAFKGVRELVTGALVILVLYSLPHLMSLTSADKGILLYFSYAFASVFFLTNTLSILRQRTKDMIPDIITAIGNGLLLLAWIMIAAPKEWQSLIISAWMVVFAVGAYAIFRATGKREPFYAYAGVGIAMLAAATSAELGGAALTIAYTLESALIIILTLNITRDVRVAERLSLLFIGPGFLSIISMVSPSWSISVFNKDFFVILIMAASLLSVGFLIRQWRKDTGKMDFRDAYLTDIIIGSVFVYILIWLAFKAALKDDDMAVMFALIVYTVVGITAYFEGKAKDAKILMTYGGILLGFVVARLLFIDVWKMALSGRIITFFLLGTMLISTAFIGKKGKRVVHIDSSEHI